MRPAVVTGIAGAVLLGLTVGSASASPKVASTVTAASSVVPAPPAVPSVVLPSAPGTAATPPAPDVAALTAAVDKALTSKALGTDVTVSVLDVATGHVLLSRGDTRPQIPASTLKVLTAVTVLRALGDDARLETKVVAGSSPGEIVLVGAGDSTLTRAPASAAVLPSGQAARPASLSALAAKTVAALRGLGRHTALVHVDDALFTGPRTAAGWPASFVASGVVSPVSALSADGGRTSAGASSRDADPALAAGKFFISRLVAAGITVTGPVARAAAPASASVLASVQSPTVTGLVERMLTQSDDDLAEALAHLAGGKVSGSASFAGGSAAVEKTLADLGVPVSGVTVVDGSGLSGLDRLPATALVQVLAAAVTDTPVSGSSAGVLWPVTSGLPIAGVTGTLGDRFVAPGTSAGRGVVRAKTGTLTGVNALSGLVLDPQGRLIAFAFVADRSPGPQPEARAALDRAASAIAAG